MLMAAKIFEKFPETIINLGTIHSGTDGILSQLQITSTELWMRFDRVPLFRMQKCLAKQFEERRRKPYPNFRSCFPSSLPRIWRISKMDRDEQRGNAGGNADIRFNILIALRGQINRIKVMFLGLGKGAHP